MLADLARPGDEVLVARGGQGGVICPVFSFGNYFGVSYFLCLSDASDSFDSETRLLNALLL